MNRPPRPYMTGSRFHSPRPFNHRWRAPGPFPQTGFQYRPSRHVRPPNTSFNNEKLDEHWCETCDRGFPTADLLSQHKQQHQKCNIDGCQFVAHPKVITKHIQMQHSSGLYKKIAKLDNPEEIQKWREERKNKYPTKTNIEKKAAECKEKIERGEKMALKRGRHDNHKSADQNTGVKRRHDFGKNNQNYNNRANTNQRQHNNVLNKKDKPPSKKVPKQIPKVPGIIEKSKLKPFAGILSINMEEYVAETICDTIESSNLLIEDDYYEAPMPIECPKQTAVQEPTLCGALTSLVCEYGSSEEEPDETENKVLSYIVKDNIKKYIDTGKVNLKKEEIVADGVKKVVETVNNDNLNVVTQTVGAKSKDNEENSDDDSPEEVKSVKSNVEDTNLVNLESTQSTARSVTATKNIFCRNNNPKHNYRYKPKIPSTLLYKLLHKEIRQERNIVLQCIRYIKKMNYFENTQ